MALDQQIRELEALPEDWNGYGEERITSLAIDTVRRLHFSPTSEGGVQIELHHVGAHVEINIDPAGLVVGVSWEHYT